MDWVEFLTADQITVEMWRDRLRANGVPSIIKDTMSFLGLSAGPVRLLVPGDMEREARATVAQLSEGFREESPLF